MDIQISQVSYGRWRISTTIKNVDYHIHTTDSEAIDLIKNKSRGYKSQIKSFVKQIKSQHYGNCTN